MKIRNKETGQVFEVMEGSIYPSFFEEVKDEDIKIGEPKVEFEIEKPEPKKVTTKKTAKKTNKSKKGAKKNGDTKTK